MPRKAAKHASSKCVGVFAKKPKLACTADVVTIRRQHVLPAENLNDVVAYFELFDLGAVLLASKRLSTLADNALKRLAVANLECLVLVTNRPGFIGIVASETRINEAEMLQIPNELLPIALENCVIDSIVLICGHCKDSTNCIWHAFRRASAKMAITRAVRCQSSCFASAQDLIDCVSQFRKLSILQVDLDDDEEFDRRALKKFARQRKVEAYF
ncbi:hypothetical protein AAVH_28992 [Aphelenchoides avenae]|nr:hypothetical protein AAVH_28992 [Aphelenchus avenae]